jgi:hypothetical protein
MVQEGYEARKRKDVAQTRLRHAGITTGFSTHRAGFLGISGRVQVTGVNRVLE